MPNLVEFNLEYECKDITEDFFIKFSEKIFHSKKIKKIMININGDNTILSKDELIKLFPNFFNFIKIVSLNSK